MTGTIPRLLRLSEVAQQLGVPLHSFYDNSHALKASGFPVPVPGTGKRYDPGAIKAWLDRQGRPNSSATEAPDDTTAANDDDVAAWQATLDARSAGLAGK